MRASPAYTMDGSSAGRESSIRGQHEPLRPGGRLRRPPVEDRSQQSSGPGVLGGVHQLCRLLSGGAQVLRAILQRTPVRGCRLIMRGFLVSFGIFVCGKGRQSVAYRSVDGVVLERSWIGSGSAQSVLLFFVLPV